MIGGPPKKQTSPRKTGLRRSHLVLKLDRRVNAKSPVKVYTTKRESGRSTSSGSATKKVKLKGAKA